MTEVELRGGVGGSDRPAAASESLRCRERNTIPRSSWVSAEIRECNCARKVAMAGARVHVRWGGGGGGGVFCDASGCDV